MLRRLDSELRDEDVSERLDDPRFRFSPVALSSSVEGREPPPDEEGAGVDSCQGPVMANRIPGFWMPAKSTRPSGEKVGPVNSEPIWLRASG